MPSLMRQMYRAGPDNYGRKGESTATPTSTRISAKALPVAVVNFGAAQNSHWGIFIFNPNSTTLGTLWELVFDNVTGGLASTASTMLFPLHSAKKRRYTVDIREDYDIDRAAHEGKRVVRLNGAVATAKRLQKACDVVLADSEYAIFGSNCQSFVIMVLRLLREWDEAHIPLAAIERVRHGEMYTVRAQERQEVVLKPDIVVKTARPRFRSSEAPLEASTSRTRHIRSQADYTSSSTDFFHPIVAVLPAPAPQPPSQGRALAVKTLRKSDPAPRSGFKIRIHIGRKSE